MKLFKTITIICTTFLIMSCAEKTDVVDSGTYTGKITEVEADKTEIYVKTEEGQTLELYFTETTSLTQNGEVIDFSVLKEDQSVEVEVKKVGQRLDPISVKLLE